MQPPQGFRQVDLAMIIKRAGYFDIFTFFKNVNQISSMVEELIDVNRKTDTDGFVANQGCFLF